MGHGDTITIHSSFSQTGRSSQTVNRDLLRFSAGRVYRAQVVVSLLSMSARERAWLQGEQLNFALDDVRNTYTGKVCVECRKRKPVSDFHKDSKGADGHKTICKACRNKARRLYHQRVRHAAQGASAYKRVRVSKNLT